MERVRFTGRILPAIHTLTVNGAQTVNMANRDFATTVTVEIQNSIVSVDVDLEKFEHKLVGELYRRAYKIARTSIDLVSFSTGKGLLLVLDTFMQPDGKRVILDFEYAPAPKLCTAYDLSPANFAPILPVALSDHTLLMALSDLTDTISWVDRTQINCARAIETIRNLIDPNPNKDAAWASMRSAINCTKDYLQLITDQSQAPRHGNYVEVGNADADEVRDRAWTVMNRFLEFRKRNNQPLPITDFPLLG